MDKLRFYKTSASYVKSCKDESKCNEVKHLVNSVMTNSITLSEAVTKYDEIVNRPDAHPMRESLTNKKLGKTLKEYSNGTLTNIEVAKMVSSVITHCLIESQVNESYSLDTNVSALTEVLREYIDTKSINEAKLNESLYQLGICDKKEVISNE